MKNKYFGYELRSGVETLTHKVCLALKLPPVNLAWVDWTTTAAINGNGDMVISNIADDAVVPASTFKRYCGFVVHELCHRKYTDFGHRASNPYVSQLKNALEDAWIEHRAIKQGITGNVEGLLTDLIDQMCAEALESVNDWSDPCQYPFVLAVYARRHAKTKMPLAQGLEPIFARAVTMLDDALNSYDVLLVAEWVYTQLQSLPQDQPGNAPQNAPGKPQSGDKGEGKGEGAGDEENASEGDGDGEGDGEGEGAGQGAGQAKAPAANCEPVCVEPQVEAPEGKGGAGTYSKTSQLSRQGYHVGKAINPLFDLECKANAKLQHEVRRLFERTDIDEWTRNHKAGALNVHALPNIATGSERLFKRRFEKDGIDSAVVILLDMSSSMFDDRNDRDAARARNAVATCNALLDTLNRAGVKTAVVTFAYETSVLKPFGMNVAQAKKRVLSLRMGGSTNDYFAVRYCHEMLLHRPEERKVLFVLTDGEGDTRETRQQVMSGERLGITTVGVGIQLDVSNVYPNNIKVADSNDLAGASFKQIKLAA